MEFNLNFKNAEKNSEKVFCFIDNCIWIGIVKLSLVRTGYFSSTANVLISSQKTWNIKGRDFYQLIWLGTNQGIWWWCCDADFNSGSACLPCCLGKVPLKQDFSDIYLTTFLESVISEIQNLLGSSFFSKYLKFILDLKNEAKYWQKVLCFWDNCIWIGIVKLSLLRRGYFSSTTNVLTSSPKTWHVKNRDFFRLHWPGNDRLIW